MDRKAWLLAGLVIAAGVGLTAAMSKRPTISAGDRVMVMGDSLGVGLTTPIRSLAVGEGVDFWGTACGGTAVFQITNPKFAGAYGPPCAQTSATTSTPNTTNNGGTLVKAALSNFKPTLVMVSFGTNEAFGQVDAATIVQSVNDLIALLRAAGARVVWIGPPKLPQTYAGNTFRPAVLQAMRDAVIAQNVPWFDSSQLDIPQFDQIHATPKGYAGWAGSLWQWLKGGAT